MKNIIKKSQNLKSKFMFLFSLFLLLPLLLIGCGEQQICFYTKATSSQILEFYQGISNPVGVAEKEKSYINNYANQIVNQSKLTENQKTTWLTLTNNLISLNNNMLLALTAIDCKTETQNAINMYDLSRIGLSRFAEFKNRQTNNDLKNFYMPLKSLTNNDNNLIPNQIVSSTQMVDFADNLIKNWGNCLNFDVNLTNGNLYTIDIFGGFYLPNEAELPETNDTNLNNYKIVRGQSAQNSKIIIVYKEIVNEVEEIYSKEVIFNETSKTIQKYKGDITTTSNPQKVGAQYSYTFENSPATGTYEIRFDAQTSYIWCKFTNNVSQSGVYSTLETYELQDGHIIARLNNVAGSQIFVQDFYFSGDGINCKIKSKETTGNLEYIKNISTINANEFATLSEQEKNTSLKITAIEIQNENIFATSN